MIDMRRILHLALVRATALRLRRIALTLVVMGSAAAQGAPDRVQTPPVAPVASGSQTLEMRMILTDIVPREVRPGGTVTVSFGNPRRSDYDRVKQVFFAGRTADFTAFGPGFVAFMVPRDLVEPGPAVVVVSFDAQTPYSVSGGERLVVLPRTTELSWVETTTWQGAVTWALIIVSASAAFGWSVYWFLGRLRGVMFTKAKLEMDILEAHRANNVLAAQAAYRLPAPQIPDFLAEALAEGSLVLFAGAGLSAQAGVPVWDDLVVDLVRRAEALGEIDDTVAEEFRKALARKETQHVADQLMIALGSPVALARHLSVMIGAAARGPAPAHHALAKLPFAAMLTTNFDELLEQSSSRRGARVFTSRDAESALNCLSRDEFFTLKLFGSLKEPTSIMLSSQQYESDVATNSALSDLLGRSFLTRTLLFVGASIDGLEAYLRGFAITTTPTKQHVALVAVVDDSWTLRALALQRRYGIVVIPFLLSTRKEAIVDFAQQLAAAAKAKLAEKEREAQDEYGTDAERQPFLKRVSLKNIGPFKELSLDLDRHWNLILGDNGVGKSTVLQAIALALCGKDASLYADRLLRTGETQGQIDLHASGGAIYTAALQRRSSGAAVDVITRSGTALEGEEWFAIAFPALRTVTWERGPRETSLGIGRPTSADLLPILTDQVDPRLDGLKQRIVTLDHLSKSAIVSGSDEARHQRLMKEFFDLFDDITKGIKVHFESVNPETREILIRTDDGVVPLESLSQGTISLISWVGVILQRLYEVARQDERPQDKYAIVLIDEIDAHMHPAWQVAIVSQLCKLFPNVQFFATTHSPLVVRGREASQVVRFRRNEEGAVERLEVEPDMTMGRHDQVLAGTLFDVDPSLDELTEEKIGQYQRLLGKSERTAEEEEQFVKIQQDLAYRIPLSDTTPKDRRARALLEALLMEQAGAVDDNLKSKIMERAEALFVSLEGGRAKR